MIDMVGIGPFITISTIVGFLQGPASVIAWLLGALLAFCDGCVWSELGARYPEAGGSYVFLQKLFGKQGRLMSFLFVWQTSIMAPLVMASAAIGFSKYFNYLLDEHPLDPIQQKMLSGSLIILMVILLYRNIKTVGKISVVLWIITGGTLLWIILSGWLKTPHPIALDISGNFPVNPVWAFALGNATQKAVYSYLGYYNVCHLGGEIKNPSKNIPRAIFISITGITILYIAMQAAVLHVLPWQAVAKSEFVISVYFQALYNTAVAKVATGLVLIIALSSLFSVMLGYSRVPYAAAVDGNFFKPFARLHPRLHFPHISLLALGGLAFVFSLLFRMGEVISAIIIMRILVQFVSQAVGVIAWRRRKEDWPWKMPLFPLPALLSIIIWLFLFFTSDWQFIAGALGVIASGILLYLIFLRKNPVLPQ